jgi:hypothetical protein
VVEYVATHYSQPVPTFAFIDPRGYRNQPFEHIRLYRSRLGEKAEALIYLPASFMARFAQTEMTQAALDRVFGGMDIGDEELAVSDRFKLADRLAEHYREKLKQEYQWATRFRVDPLRHNDYFLLFGTDHPDGLRAMKQAMWKVDPHAGRAYQQNAMAAMGQVPLFDMPAESDDLPREEALPVLLAEHFRDDEFSVDDAEMFALTQTQYLDTHVRTFALQPLEAAGKLKVLTARARAGTFPAGTRMKLFD